MKSLLGIVIGLFISICIMVYLKAYVFTTNYKGRIKNQDYHPSIQNANRKSVAQKQFYQNATNNQKIMHENMNSNSDIQHNLSAAVGTLDQKPTRIIDAADVNALNEILRDRSLKKEIILLQSDIQYLDLTLNVILDLEQLNLHNHLVYMETEEQCVFVQSLGQNIGCVWMSLFLQDHPVKSWHKIRHIWMVRWIIFAKILQLGYNILMIDSDMAVRHNPYHYLKQLPFSQYTLVVAFEGGYPGINCGSVYAQNADPEGPVVWMAQQVAERTLRWLENPEFLSKKLGTDDEWAFEDALFEQSIFMDAACSAFHQYPIFYHSFRPPEVLQEARKQREKWDQLHYSLCNENTAWNKSSFQYNSRWRYIAGSYNETLKWHYLFKPIQGNITRSELGGQAFPSEQGEFSLKLQTYMIQSATQVVYTSSKTPYPEKIIQAPLWLFSRWPEWGRSGYWQLDPARAVLAHTVLTQGRDGQGKYSPLKLFGWWHWEVETITQHLNPTSVTYTKYVSFVPGFQMQAVEKEEVWEQLQHSIIKIGVLSNRRIVWPVVHCNSPWIRKSDPILNHPVNIDDPGIVVFAQSNSTLRCLWFGLMSKGCHQAGIASYDFVHVAEIKDQIGKSHYSPNIQNTLAIPQQATLQARQAQKLIESYEQVEVLFLQNSNFKIVGFPGEYLDNLQAFYDVCQPPPIP